MNSNTTVVPSWLDVSKEVVGPGQPREIAVLNGYDMVTGIKNPKHVKTVARTEWFITICMETLLGVGLTMNRAFEVTANAVVETGWGEHWKGWNMGGWKIWETDVQKAKRSGKLCPGWWRAPGHINSGDPEWCFYRTFSGPDMFFKEWLERFVPKVSSDKHRYHRTGLLFWEQPQLAPWFPELIQAGYKGEVTKANPNKSISSFNNIVIRSQTILAQKLLKVEADAVWGQKSKQACASFQGQSGMLPTGNLTKETLTLLVKTWQGSGFVI